MAMDTKAMYKLSYGLFVCNAVRGDKKNGCIINTAIQVASDPNTISIAVNKANYTHDMINEIGLCTVSVISQEATFDLFKHFGFQSGRDGVRVPLRIIDEIRHSLQIIGLPVGASRPEAQNPLCGELFLLRRVRPVNQVPGQFRNLT